MPCYHPLTAYQTADNAVFFSERKRNNTVRTLQLPCGQCIGCRLERSRQWAIRCLNEKQLHKHNAYVTLTYKDETIPENGTLRYRDYQLFMKRLVKHFRPHKIRFYMCGEYGTQTNRPHYHAILFNVRFEDQQLHSENVQGNRLYSSPTLDRIWQLGHGLIGEVTFESAAYVARYITTKITGQLAESHYERLTLDGEIIRLEPEFNHMSLKPGIGKRWLERYYSDVYPTGQMVVNGTKVRPPRYYDKLFKKLDEENYDEMTFRRHIETQAHAADNTPARLHVKEQVLRARTKTLKRSLA